MTTKKFIDNNDKFFDLYKKARDKKDLYLEHFRGFQENFWNCFDLGFIDGSIEQQIGKRNLKYLQKYENYIVSVLQLYSALCKGRNKKMLKEIQNSKGINLNQRFIKRCIQYFSPQEYNPKYPKKEQVHLRYYRCFVDLYDTFFIDLEPLTRVSQYTNKCFVKEDIKDYNIENKKSFWMYKDIILKKDKKGNIEANFKDLLSNNQ